MIHPFYCMYRTLFRVAILFGVVLFCHDSRVWLWSGAVVFQRELSLRGMDDVVGHLLIAAKIVAGKLARFTVYFHIGRRIDAVGTLIPKDQGCLEGLVLQILDEHTSTKFPKFLKVVEIGSVARNKGIHLE